LGHGFIKATTWGEGMSGDHNQYQKGKSYLDDFTGMSLRDYFAVKAM
jgi:hypothetical protein